jgi:MYXO-CTERM domain-containing protein
VQVGWLSVPPESAAALAAGLALGLLGVARRRREAVSG